jgi:hypothetical protein
MQLNFFLTMGISAIVPLLVGFIWYHPKVFGTAWLKAGGFDEAKMKEGFNAPLVFGLTLVLGFFISMILSGMTIHQMGFYSMLERTIATDQETKDFFMQTMQKYGGEFRTFKHGMLHGSIAGVMLVTPIIAINAMFERKGFKYIAVNAGFWIACFTIMSGIICQFADLSSFS